MASERIESGSTPASDAKVQQFVGLLTANDRPLKSYILSLVPDLADAEQIAQETNLRLWQQFDSFDPAKGTFAAWARTVAHFQVLSFRKQAARERLIFDSEVVEKLAERTAEQAEHLAAQQAALVDCVNRLPAHSRELVREYYFCGLKLRAAAEKLGRTVAAVEMAVVRIRRVLFDCVRQTLRREERT